MLVALRAKESFTIDNKLKICQRVKSGRRIATTLGNPLFMIAILKSEEILKAFQKQIKDHN